MRVWNWELNSSEGSGHPPPRDRAEGVGDAPGRGSAPCARSPSRSSVSSRPRYSRARLKTANRTPTVLPADWDKNQKTRRNPPVPPLECAGEPCRSAGHARKPAPTRSAMHRWDERRVGARVTSRSARPGAPVSPNVRKNRRRARRAPARSGWCGERRSISRRRVESAVINNLYGSNRPTNEGSR